MTADAAPVAEAPTSRLPLLATVAGGLLLVIGLVVLVLGQSAASTASDDLAREKGRLREQRASTTDAQSAQSTLDARAAKLVTDAQALLATSEAITAQDAELVASARDQQRAGVQDQIDAYNAAADRGNAAATQFNTLIESLDQQLETFRKDSAAVASS